MQVRWHSAFGLVLLLILQSSGLLHYLHLRIDHEGWDASECRACLGELPAGGKPRETDTKCATLERGDPAAGRCAVCDMHAATRMARTPAAPQGARLSACEDTRVEPQGVSTPGRERGARLARAPPAASSLFLALS